VEKTGIDLIPANTPQAKGRIERLLGTLQDRLPVWFKMDGITALEAVNHALPQFIAEYNTRFVQKMPIPPSSRSTLMEKIEKLLPVRHERVTDTCGCFSFRNFLFQIQSERALVKKKITFL
jgi:hypothetical protein